MLTYALNAQNAIQFVASNQAAYLLTPHPHSMQPMALMGTIMYVSVRCRGPLLQQRLPLGLDRASYSPSGISVPFEEQPTQ